MIEHLATRKEMQKADRPQHYGKSSKMNVMKHTSVQVQEWQQFGPLPTKDEWVVQRGAVVKVGQVETAHFPLEMQALSPGTKNSYATGAYYRQESHISCHSRYISQMKVF